MRTKLLREVARAGMQGEASNDFITEEEFARRLLTDRHGAHVSAWFIKKHKASIRVHGYFIAHLPKGGELPMWFAIGVRFLRSRPKSWDVHEHVAKGVRYWRITWKRHLTYARGRVARA